MDDLAIRAFDVALRSGKLSAAALKVFWYALRVDSKVRASGDTSGALILSVREAGRYCRMDRKSVHRHVRSIRKVRLFDAREHSRDKTKGLYTVWVFHGPPDKDQSRPDPQLRLRCPPKRCLTAPRTVP